MESLATPSTGSLASFSNTDLYTLPDPSFSIGQDGHLRHHFVFIPQVPYSSSTCADAKYTTHRTKKLPHPIRQHPIWTLHIRAEPRPLEIFIHEAIEPSLWPLVRPYADTERHFNPSADLLTTRSLRFRITSSAANQPTTDPIQHFHVVVPRLARHEWNRIYRVFLYPRVPLAPNSGIGGTFPLLSIAAARAGEQRVSGAVHTPSASLCPPFAGRNAIDAHESFADLDGVRLAPSTVDTCRAWGRVSSWHAASCRLRDANMLPPDAPLVRPRDVLLDKCLPGRWYRSVSAGPESAFPQLRDEERESAVSKAVWAFVDGVVRSRAVRALLLSLLAVWLVDLAARGTFKVVDDVVPAVVDDVVPAVVKGATSFVDEMRRIGAASVAAYRAVVYVLETTRLFVHSVVLEGAGLLMEVFGIFVVVCCRYGFLLLLD